MPYVSLAIAAHLLASDQKARALPEPATDTAVLVQRESDVGDGSALSVWMPIVADGSAKQLSASELRRLAAATEHAIATEEPTFVVDNLRAGRPRALGHDGGVAGDMESGPGFDLGISVFAASSIPPDLQLQLIDAVAAVENYFENTVHNAVIGAGGQPQDVSLRLALRVTALAANVPGASRIRAVSVPMSDLTRKLANPLVGDDGDDFATAPIVGADGDARQPTVPTYVDSDGAPRGVPSMRVRYSGASSASSSENRVFLTRAQYIALGFAVGSTGPSTQQFDGEILMNSGFQWDYDPSDGASLNQVTRFSFQDYLVREILIQLGWISGIDFLQRDMTMLDMYRFSSLAPTRVSRTDGPAFVFFLDPDFETATGSASLTNSTLAALYSSGNTLNDLPLDYNPGVDVRLVPGALGIINDPATSDGVDVNVLGNLISSEITADGDPPSPRAAADLSLLTQLAGLAVPVPAPNAANRPTVLDADNRFDDGEWPALSFDQRTRYPDGAAPTVVGWPAPPRAQWNFNEATLAAAGSTNIASASTPFGTGAGAARIDLVGGLTVQSCSLPFIFTGSSDPTREPNRGLRIAPQAPATGWVSGAGIVVRCGTAVGAPAPSVYFDMMLDEYASSTWRFEYSNNGTAFSSLGLPNDGYFRFGTPGTFRCAIRFDLLGTLTGGANTAFRVTAVAPQGSAPGTPLQSVSEAGGGSEPHSPFSVVEFDMITVSPTVGAQLLVDYNERFRGHMPRVVARGARSHLNFAMEAERVPAAAPSRVTGDVEFPMGTGNSFNNSRASFITQTTVAIAPWRRYLMGQSSTSASTTIPRGITYWTRDPAAYAADAGPLSKAWQPLGTLPDFLSQQELLILDHLGWDITVFATTTDRPSSDLWPDLEGNQLHTVHPGFDETGPAQP